MKCPKCSELTKFDYTKDKKYGPRQTDMYFISKSQKTLYKIWFCYSCNNYFKVGHRI